MRLRIARLASISASLLIVGALGACSLFVDTDGLSSGGIDAAVVDATTDVPIESDARIPGVADAADAAPAAFCASHPGHVLCYDFDESMALPPADNTLFDPGHLVVDDTVSVSPEDSLLGIYDVGDSNQQFQKNLTSTQGKVSWALDLKISASDLSTGQTSSLATDVPAVEGLSDHFFYLQTYYNTLDISESATPADGGPPTYTSTNIISPVPVDVWMHIEFTVDGTSGVISVSYNGTALPAGQAQFGFANGPMQVTVGGYAGNLPVTTNIHLDNVLVDL